ncbi:tRNA pseudouridine(13) synthase TruD [Marinagarivorans algicola]|uniref:tRNA pseudouridine(13) synthase TruD n=1 Tax=Marinagarivorans algicola TaxID=1513270 RepID=UPI0006B52524|nr:tRNA pseudouridine(13) synthase TruD [Marinagarivorans algicola]
MTDAKYPLDFPYAYGKPALRALLKGENAHFVVHEQLGFEPAGEGEHWYVHTESDGDNTQWLADQMAKALGVKALDIGFCGLKDRHAITRQWFSIYDPKQSIHDLKARLAPALPNSQILEVTRGQAKLRRGMHAGNGFIITLVFSDLALASIQAPLVAKLEQIKACGVPNYFGLQRFGRNGNNLQEFDRFLLQQEAVKASRDSTTLAPTTKKGRNKPRKPKGIILSAARAYLFNCVLAERVKSETWQCVIDGDVTHEGHASALNQCVTQNAKPLIEGSTLPENVATAPLWGRGRSHTAGRALMIEQEALHSMSAWANALEHLGLSQERRKLCSVPQDFMWGFDDKDAVTLRLIFSLPPGEYATGILREVCECYEPDRS